MFRAVRRCVSSPATPPKSLGKMADDAAAEGHAVDAGDPVAAAVLLAEAAAPKALRHSWIRQI